MEKKKKPKYEHGVENKMEIGILKAYVAYLQKSLDSNTITDDNAKKINKISSDLHELISTVMKRKGVVLKQGEVLGTDAEKTVISKPIKEISAQKSVYALDFSLKFLKNHFDKNKLIDDDAKKINKVNVDLEKLINEMENRLNGEKTIKINDDELTQALED